MADTVTPVLGLVKPEVNGPQTENVWGFDLNENFDKIDDFASISRVTEAPLDGLTYGRGNGAWGRVPTIDDFWALGSSDALKAPIASPAFTGNPTAPTPAVDDNDTSIATTAFVKSVTAAVGAVFPSNAAPLADGAAAPGVSAEYSRADHVHPASSVATDPTKVAKAGDTMTGALHINSGGIWVYGWGGNSDTGVLFMNVTGNKYLHQTGASFSFVGQPVHVTDVTPSTATNNGALVVGGGAGIGGQLNVGGPIGVGGAGTFGNSIKLPDTTGIGWGNFPHIANTPELIYLGGKFVFANHGQTAVLEMNPTTRQSTFGGGIYMPAGQAFNYGGHAVTFGNAGALVARAGLYSFDNAEAELTFAQISASGMRIYPTTAAGPGGTTGALTVAGGLGVVGSSYFGNDITAGIDIYAGRTVYVGGATAGWAFGYPIGMGVKWAGGLASNYGIGCRPVTDNPSATAIVFLNSAGTAPVGSIAQTPTLTQYGTTSDGKLKKDRKPIDSGELIDRLEAYDFAWEATGERGYGVIAQDAAEVVPQACYRDVGFDQWMTDYSKFVPILLAEMKALRARVAELEGRA